MAKDPTVYCDREWSLGSKVPATEQVVFGFNGRIYETTLSDFHAKLFSKAMQEFIEHANDTGLKMPPLPKALREEFLAPPPGLPQNEDDEDVEGVEVDQDEDEPPTLPFTPAEQRKPATPAFTPAVPANRVKANRVTPPGDDVPLEFWKTPQHLHGKAKAAVFVQARKDIYEFAGLKPIKGMMPAAVKKAAYRWAAENPERVQELVRLAHV